MAREQTPDCSVSMDEDWDIVRGDFGAVLSLVVCSAAEAADPPPCAAADDDMQQLVLARRVHGSTRPLEVSIGLADASAFTVDRVFVRSHARIIEAFSPVSGYLCTARGERHVESSAMFEAEICPPAAVRGSLGSVRLRFGGSETGGEMTIACIVVSCATRRIMSREASAVDVSVIRSLVGASLIPPGAEALLEKLGAVQQSARAPAPAATPASSAAAAPVHVAAADDAAGRRAPGAHGRALTADDLAAIRLIVQAEVTQALANLEERLVRLLSANDSTR